MSLRLSLPQRSVDVAAGQSVLVDVRVTNTGTSSRRIRLDVTGRAAPWVHLTADPDGQALDRDGADGLALAAGAGATLALLVAPPRTSALADQMVPFTVRAIDRDTGGPSASATGLVVVRSPATVTATLAPQSVVGRRGSRHVLHLTTDDPAGVLVTLRAGAVPRRARVTVDPVVVRVEAGRPAQSEVTVVTGPTVLRRRQHDVEVVWETGGPAGLVRGVTHGRLDQLPLLPPVVAVALGITLAGALAVGAWQVWPSAADRRQAVVTDAGPTARPDPETSAPAPARPFVIVDVELKEPDPVLSLTQAQASAAATAVRGAQRSRVVDGADDPDLRRDFWVVVVEGFGDVQEAQRYCEERQQPDCSVVE